MGHNKAGETRARRLKRKKKEEKRLYCGKKDKNSYAPCLFGDIPGVIFYVPVRNIIVPKEKKPEPMSLAPIKNTRRDIKRYGTIPLFITKDYHLVAGWRNLRVCKQLGYRVVPCKIKE